MTKTPTNTELQTNLLATLRQTIPERQLGEKDALRVAEQQAECLRKLFDVHKPRFPHEALMDIPKIEVDFSRDMPVSGSTIWNGENWLILINAYDNPWRQRFTLAHEFKHIIDHPHRKRMYRGKAGCHPHQQSERAADHFAGCLLMPETQLKHLYLQGVQRLTELSKHFQVSPRAVRFRLKQIGLIGNRCGPGMADEGNVQYNRSSVTRVSA